MCITNIIVYICVFFVCFVYSVPCLLGIFIPIFAVPFAMGFSLMPPPSQSVFTLVSSHFLQLTHQCRYQSFFVHIIHDLQHACLFNFRPFSSLVCKSCIVKHFFYSNRCPNCSIVVHQTQPLYSIR